MATEIERIDVATGPEMERVASIAAAAGDNETAHILQDDLFVEFIAHVAITAPEPWSSMAAEVLKTKDIQFSRWYA